MFVDTSFVLAKGSSRLVVRGAASSIWDAVSATETGLAIWERSLPASLSRLDQIVAASDIDAIFVVQTFADCFGKALDAAGYDRGECRDALTIDIAALVRLFSTLMRLDQIKVRLEWVTGDACRKFHADYITARAICTYVGRGTEWIYGSIAPSDPEGITIHHLGTGDAALFKGKLGDPDIPLLHRSPPIAGTGERRLLLVISPPPVKEPDKFAADVADIFPR